MRQFFFAVLLLGAVFMAGCGGNQGTYNESEAMKATSGALPPPVTETPMPVDGSMGTDTIGTPATTATP